MENATVKKLLVLVGVIVFVLGAFGVHYHSVSGVRVTDVGLAFVAASFLVP